MLLGLVRAAVSGERCLEPPLEVLFEQFFFERNHVWLRWGPPRIVATGGRECGVLPPSVLFIIILTIVPIEHRPSTASLCCRAAVPHASGRLPSPLLPPSVHSLSSSQSSRSPLKPLPCRCAVAPPLLEPLAVAAAAAERGSPSSMPLSALLRRARSSTFSPTGVCRPRARFGRLPASSRPSLEGAKPALFCAAPIERRPGTCATTHPPLLIGRTLGPSTTMD